MVAGAERREALPPFGAEAGAWDGLGRALVLVNDADERTDAGDPTELALVRAASAAGFDRAALERELPRVGEVPFDADRRRMSTIHRDDRGAVLYVKGAPEAVLAPQIVDAVHGSDRITEGEDHRCRRGRPSRTRA